MAIRLTEGTIETVPVDVFDRTGLITDLSTMSPTFDLQKEDDSYIYDNEAATATLMKIFCNIDISAAGPDGLQPHDTRLRLFVSFDPPGFELPRLGPVDIIVKARN